MRLEPAKSHVVMTTADDVIHVPFSLYLSEEFPNPNTQVAVARSLRALLRLCDAFNIDLATRALAGRWLTEAEKKALRQIAFRPIEEIEAMSDHAVKTIASAKKNADPSRTDGAVAPNTADKQLIQIAEFLSWYHKKVIRPRLPLGSSVAQALQLEVETCGRDLKRAIAGTTSMHPHKIKSAPAESFKRLYRKIWLEPEDVFKSGSGNAGENLLRDRAMVLLAAEGIRPGAIGSVRLADFQWLGGKSRGHVAITDNIDKRSKKVTAATPRQKGIGSRQEYNSEITVALMATTASAVKDYIDGERQIVTGRTLRNRSEGFLFLADHGGVIGDRSTITKVFKRAGTELQRLGLLAKDPKDPYLEGEEYNFTAYLLRHSSASIFFAEKAKEMDSEVVEDLMRTRYGWSQKSDMPSLYARRAMSDAASLSVDEFVDSLLEEAKARKQASGAAT